MKTIKERAALIKISGIVKSQLANRLPPFTETLQSARNKLSELVVAAKSIEQRGVAKGATAEITMSLDSVIASMRAFRSGYASNDESQQIDPSAVPGFAAANMTKAELAKALKDQADAGYKRVSVADFATYAASILKGLATQALPEQLAALRSLERLVSKATEEDVAGVAIPIENDPMKHNATSENGSVQALSAATSAAAPSNFSSNPVVPAASVGTPAPSTGSMTTEGNGGTPSSNNYGTTEVIAPTGNAPATSSPNVQTAVAETAGLASNNFSDSELQKSEDDLDAATSQISDVTKSSDEYNDWPLDLTCDAFMNAHRDPAKDFGADKKRKR